MTFSRKYSSFIAACGTGLLIKVKAVFIYPPLCMFLKPRTLPLLQAEDFPSNHHRVDLISP